MYGMLLQISIIELAFLWVGWKLSIAEAINIPRYLQDDS
jgi:hypothetical protein